ncbi:MAG: acylphosphatase [Candidatus Cloacimonetes bacterium]|jgi:acylphosphatase|nr:acylphosphatase [Candidatus Cloacimonadota bacterium]
MKAFEILVSGRVQGVGYRYFVLRKAKLHKINGYVKNLYDGRVKILATGDDTALKEFRNELENGPFMSYTSNIDITDIQLTKRYESFSIEF